MASVSEVCCNATYHLMEWEKVQQSNPPNRSPKNASKNGTYWHQNFFFCDSGTRIFQDQLGCFLPPEHLYWRLGMCSKKQQGRYLGSEFWKAAKLSSPLHAEAAGALRSVERAFQLGNDSRCCGDRCINPYECLDHLLGIGARMEFCLGKHEIYYVMILLRQ